ncbi:hypothetical protein GH714_005615 [Hevea brasiliensis]|uniref:RNase H type-1 domain-containing protein n=1 Tax=Hevea brasiliensis TaxID=3981 RepID=A0A6A6LIE9_HEVBR|nr:hypothetical protein GH714_005615 [Hevea brasiliensis]
MDDCDKNWEERHSLGVKLVSNSKMDKLSSKPVVRGSDKGKRVTRDNSNQYGSRFLALIEDVVNVVDQDDSLVNGKEVPCHKDNGFSYAYYVEMATHLFRDCPEATMVWECGTVPHGHPLEVKILMVGFYKKMNGFGICSSMVTELHALVHGLRFPWNMGFRKVEVNLDFFVVTNMALNKSPVGLRMLGRNPIAVSKREDEVFISRETNQNNGENNSEGREQGREKYNKAVRRGSRWNRRRVCGGVLLLSMYADESPGLSDFQDAGLPLQEG